MSISLRKTYRRKRERKKRKKEKKIKWRRGQEPLDSFRMENQKAQDMMRLLKPNIPSK